MEGFWASANNGKNILNVHQRSALQEGGAGSAFATQLQLIEDLIIEAHFAVVNSIEQDKYLDWDAVEELCMSMLEEGPTACVQCQGRGAQE